MDERKSGVEEGRLLDFLSDLTQKALKAGAQEAEASCIEASSLAVSWRQGKLESLEQSLEADVGLRVFVGRQQAIVSSSDRTPQALDLLVARAVSMAKAAPEDPFCGLAEPAQLARVFPDLPLADSYEVNAEDLIACAKRAEAAVLAAPGGARAETTGASAGESLSALVTSHGFQGAYRRTGYGLSAEALAGEGTAMEMDGKSSSTVFKEDLETPENVGRIAAERVLSSLGARKMPSQRAPVVFDPRVGSGFLSALSGAISGASIARGTSFLKDFLGKQIFAPGITVIDDPYRPRGIRSRLFDGEGLAPQRRAIVEDGVLTTWLLDLRSARQLGLTSTGHASRGVGSLPSPSPTNFYIEPGQKTPAEIIADIKEGFYVTSLMGMGVNGVTGDYSRAARGFWIENGQISFPVNELTIAGNLKDMFLHLTAANDLSFLYGLDAPTLMIESMTIAGV